MTEEIKKPKREIGVFYAIIIGLGSTLGIEFFVLLDYATDLAGPSVLLSLMISGLVNLFIMFNYAELSSSISKVGAEYTFTKVAFGGFICFLAGWLRWLSSIFTTTLSALGLAEAVTILFPEINSSLLAITIIVVFTVISVKGGKLFDLAMVLSFIIVFATLGLASTTNQVSVENLHPFMPNGFFPGVLAGSMYTFNMFVGMRAIATKSPEMKEPGKTFPKAVLVSTLITVTIYCSISFLAIGIIPPEIRPSVNLLVYLGEAVMGETGQLLVVIAMTAAALMSLATSMTVQTSILSALSRDGYIPSIIFSPRKNIMTRYIPQLIGSLIAILFTATGLIVFVGYASGFASLIVFALVNLSLIKLRIDKPDLERSFKVPLYPYTPIIGIGVAIILMVFVESSAILLVLEFMMVAMIIYHLKMVGLERLRLAAGGINLGVSGFIILLLYLFETKAWNIPLFSQHRSLVLVVGAFLAIIFFLSSILNVATGKKTVQEKLQIDESTIKPRFLIKDIK